MVLVSHFSVLVLTDQAVTRETAQDVVEPLLAPYDENGEWFAEGSRWDWWVVGGRWTGSLSGYDPTEDIANYEVCIQCGGTGLRPDWRRFGSAWRDGMNGCNGCMGNGLSLKWGFESHDGDVQPVSALPDDFVPFSVVTPDGQWLERGRMGFFAVVIKDEHGNGEKNDDAWEAAYGAILDQHPNATAVLVDCHV